MGDFTTPVKYKKIIRAVLNNSELGKISKEQQAGEWPVWEIDRHDPNFATFTKLRGVHDIRVKTEDKLKAALEEALVHDIPALVEITTDAELILSARAHLFDAAELDVVSVPSIAVDRRLNGAFKRKSVDLRRR